MPSIKEITNSLKSLNGFESYLELADSDNIVKLVGAEGVWRLGSTRISNKCSLTSEIVRGKHKGIFAEHIRILAQECEDSGVSIDTSNARCGQSFAEESVAIAESIDGDIVFVNPAVGDEVFVYRHDSDVVDRFAPDLKSWLSTVAPACATDEKFDSLHVGKIHEWLLGHWQAVESKNLNAETIAAQPTILIDENRNWIQTFNDPKCVFAGRYAITSRSGNMLALLDDEGEVHRYEVVKLKTDLLILKGPDSGVVVRYDRFE